MARHDVGDRPMHNQEMISHLPPDKQPPESQCQGSRAQLLFLVCMPRRYFFCCADKLRSEEIPWRV